MKTKIIPFDLETAKKIQAGEIEGKIKTHDREDVRIICWDAYRFCDNEIIALVKVNDFDEVIGRYKRDGHLVGESGNHSDLVLEVPDNEPQEPQFKPFDRVLVRENSASYWKAGIYSHKLDDKHFVSWNYFKQCIPYAGNENLVGTTDKPKEE